jgi:O-antigen ligase
VSLAARTEWWRPAVAEASGSPAVSWPRDEAASGALAFRALLAFTFVLILSPQTIVPALQPFRIALVAALVAIGAQLGSSLVGGRPLTVRRREMALAAGLVGWAVVTVPLSYWPGGSTSFLLDLYLKTVALFWLLANAVDTLPRLRQAAWSLSLIAVPLALAGIRSYLSGVFIVTAHSVKRIGGYEGGLTANPNDLALMLNMILPLTLALLGVARSLGSRALLVTIAVLQVACIVLTFSRAGFLTLATIVLVYLWRLARRGRLLYAGLALAGALTAVSVVPGAYLERLATITDPDADPTGSAQARWTDTMAALRFVLAHPVVGAGAGMNTLALNEVRGPSWMEVHNVYLEWAADLGLPGLALFLLLMFSCLKRARSVRRHAASTAGLAPLAFLAEGIEVSLLAFAVAAFFYPVAYHPFFYFPAGLAVAADVLCGKATVREIA